MVTTRSQAQDSNRYSALDNSAGSQSRNKVVQNNGNGASQSNTQDSVNSGSTDSISTGFTHKSKMATTVATATADDDRYETMLRDKMEYYEPGCTTPWRKEPHYASVYEFRVAMGSALAEDSCLITEDGYAWLVDTVKDHRARLGDLSAIPLPMPQRPVFDATANKAARLQYNNDLTVYTKCRTWRNIGIKLLEEKYPECLNLKKGKFGLPLSVTLREAFDHVMDNANQDTDKRETFITLSDALNIKIKDFTHVPKGNSCAIYLDSIKHDVDRIDSLDVDPLSMKTLIMKCQQAIRTGVGERMDLLRTVDKAWETKYNGLPANID